MQGLIEYRWPAEVNGHRRGAASLPRGPWTGEPDKAQWIDPLTDLDCLVVRGPSAALCGYVGLPPGHPWHGLGYSEHIGEQCADEWCYEHSPEAHIRVHGGLTFSDSCSPSDDEAFGIWHVPQAGRPGDVWWFGFDCAHSGDLSPAYDHHYPMGGMYRSFGYVQREVASLARQLAAVSGERLSGPSR